jgi:hypothetical protein
MMDGAWPFAGRIFLFNVNGLGIHFLLRYFIFYYFLRDRNLRMFKTMHNLFIFPPSLNRVSNKVFIILNFIRIEGYEKQLVTSLRGKGIPIQMIGIHSSPSHHTTHGSIARNTIAPDRQSAFILTPMSPNDMSAHSVADDRLVFFFDTCPLEFVWTNRYI